MAFSSQLGCIDFLGINPQYRKQGIHKLFLDALMDIYLPGQEISMTTYREDDKADTGHRDILKQLGFAERELLIEFGYPTQRFVLPPKYMEDTLAVRLPPGGNAAIRCCLCPRRFCWERDVFHYFFNTKAGF
ncbi:hypothetical protein [uncultured Oscillibacter sp.]|uniref:hypothetical protein n=1 Tax=uncultured Oscillibacter sp. TaxID=876091 RepID=UPI0035A5E52F